MERIWIFMKITEDIIYAGVNDHQVDLFEGQYRVPNGMAYNSYVILDEKTAVMDTVDANFADEWLANVAKALDGRKPDYLIVQHMEPDHSANIENFVKAYPEATVVANTKTFAMMKNFFPKMDLAGKKLEVKDGESLTLGKHVLTFVFAPMVHWPEVMVTYDSTDKVLFAADGFGKFGALDREEPWDDEARRYFIGIVGKYGLQVQKLLKVAGTLDIRKICSLHGPVLTENLGHYIEKYDIWSSYRPEEEGVVVAYTSVYGNTKKAAELLAAKLKEKGCRITKQRLRLIDIILQNECSSCKEIFYRALEEDDKLGVATVYRMVNLLEEIGAISRKNMYKVAYSENCMMENACTIELDDGSIHHLSAKKWNSVIRAGLKSCGYLVDQRVSNVTIRPCECAEQVC